MTHPLVAELSSSYGKLPFEEVEEGVAFVLGHRLEDDATLPVRDTQRLHDYFSSIHSPQMQPDANPDADETLAGLTVRNWRQFKEIDLDLSAQLTIITGENSTGKTSLLNLLGQALGVGTQFLGTPTRDEKGFSFQHGRRRASGEFEQFGLMTFGSGAGSKVGTRQWEGSVDPSFSPELVPYRSLPGIYLDATRIIGPYQRLDTMPVRFRSAREIESEYAQQVRNMWVPGMLMKSPALMIKEALVAAAMFGEGNSVVVGDPIAARVWAGFQEVLQEVFPASLGFERLQVDQGEIIIRSRSGRFALEAASGGLAALVTLTWQIYLHQFDSADTFTVCFDEPENHLHPSLQRSLLPALLRAFPTVKFVVATHSPFIVTSIKTATIYSLRRNEDGSVYSTMLDLSNQVATANEILSDVLGVGVTMPIWAENELGEILSRLRRGASPEDVSDAMDLIEAAGMRVSTPDVAEAIASAITARAIEGGS